MFNDIILIFKNLTRIRTRADINLYYIIVILFFIVLWIQRIPDYEMKDKIPVYGTTISEKIRNIAIDVVLSNLLATLSYIILS